jgi:hypothetical protein
MFRKHITPRRKSNAVLFVSKTRILSLTVFHIQEWQESINLTSTQIMYMYVDLNRDVLG